MTEYHKINSIYKRDPGGKQMLFGQYSRPEFEYLKDCPWEFTEKVDGTNIRILWDGTARRIGGKTDNAQIPVPLFQRLLELFPESLLAASLEPNTVLYGEGYGGKIQKGGATYGPTQDFVLFDVRCGTWWLRREDVMDIAQKLSVRVVPVIGVGTLASMESLCRNGLRSTWGDFQAEGVVARPTAELYARSGDRIITKLKCTDFVE